jgi:hypothetical protein
MPATAVWSGVVPGRGDDRFFHVEQGLFSSTEGLLLLADWLVVDLDALKEY